MPPRQPRKMVGRSAASRGPSEASSRSAFSSSRRDAQTLLRSGEPISSPISTRNLALKPSLPPRASRTRGKRCEIDRVLALVVGGAAAIDAVANGCCRPGIEPAAPFALHARDHIAMAVDQNGRKPRILAILGDQERRLAARRLHQPAFEIELGKARAASPFRDRRAARPRGRCSGFRSCRRHGAPRFAGNRRTKIVCRTLAMASSRLMRRGPFASRWSNAGRSARQSASSSAGGRRAACPASLTTP